MKRLVFLLLPMVCLWGLNLPVLNAAGELLSNGDFEEWSGGLPVGWVKDGTVTVSQNAATVHTGNSSAQLVRGSSNYGITQSVPVTANVPYEFSCWLQAPAASDGRIRILFRDAAMTTLKTGDLRIVASGGVWEQVTTGPVYAPAGTAFATVNIRVYTTSGTTIYADDASLQEVSLDLINTAFSSEWDATAYNGGRRMVRDADGIFHMVFHSQMVPGSTPGNPQTSPRACAIFYTHTIRPVIDLPPPLQGPDWTVPVPIAYTDVDTGLDDRHPSIAIEYDGTYPHINNDRIHVVWQKERTPGGVYDICYATLPNEPSGIGTWTGPWGASGSPSDYWLYVSNDGSSEVDRDSLVPVVDVSNNFVHVAWQEEDLVDVMGSFYSEILYKVSWDASWSNTWLYYRNISESPDTNSQVPSISVAHDDRYNYGYVYPSQTIRIVWNDDYVSIGTAPHIWMATSGNNGFTWDTVSGITGGTEISALAGTDGDGYPCIAVEPWNGAGAGGDHIVYMNNVAPADPDDLVLGRIGATFSYDPGVDPNLTNCFPGPDVGMYTARFNRIYYYSTALGTGGYYIAGTTTTRDTEFPTITTSGQGLATETRRLWVNYQEYYTSASNYEIRQDTCIIDATVLSTFFQWWSTDENISDDSLNDDLFPNLAAKKQGMYWPQGRELGFTKIAGSGRPDAMASTPKSIYFSSSSEWENPKNDINVWHIPSNVEPAPVTMRNPLASLDTDSAVFVYCGGAPAGTIWGGTLYYRKMDVNNGAAWSSSPFNYDSTPGNEYFMASFPINGTFSAGDIVEYYLAMSGDTFTTSPVYLYGDNASSLRSRIEAVAQGHPYRFTVGVGPTATPTADYSPTPSPTSSGPTPSATPSTVPLINTWHIPPVQEACNSTTSMRDPVTPWDPSQAVWIHTGVYPITGADSVTVYYRESTAGSWSSFSATHECNYLSNDYWGEAIPGGTATWTETVEYYILVTKSGSTNTYVCWVSGSSTTTDNVSTAQSNPFSFTYGNEPSVTPTPTATSVMTITPTPVETPIPLVNCWHIPDSLEACNSSTTMRVPLNPWNPANSTWIHTGIYPIGAASSVTIHYRNGSSGPFSSVSSGWECNYSSNDYWGEAIPALTATWGETIEYYLEVQGSGYVTTYVYYPGDVCTTTNVEATAQTAPYAFTYPAEPTVTPTPSETPDYSPSPTPTASGNLMNVWHIPSNDEPPSVTMRNPVVISDATATVYIYVGGYLIENTISSGTLYHREVGATVWNTSTFNYDSTNGNNEYWMASFDRAAAGYSSGDSVEYYLEISGSGDTTYLYGDDDSSNKTGNPAVAQADPYTFTVLGAVPATTPFGIGLLILMLSGLMVHLRRK